MNTKQAPWPQTTGRIYAEMYRIARAVEEIIWPTPPTAWLQDSLSYHLYDKPDGMDGHTWEREWERTPHRTERGLCAREKVNHLSEDGEEEVRARGELRVVRKDGCVPKGEGGPLQWKADEEEKVAEPPFGHRAVPTAPPNAGRASLGLRLDEFILICRFLKF